MIRPPIIHPPIIPPPIIHPPIIHPMIRSTRGYSLMELVVVLAILAVAAALIGPAVGRAADAARARAEAGAVAAFLRAAREQAVTGRQPVEVTLDRETHGLLLQRRAREGEPSVLARRAFSARVAMDAGMTSAGVTFLPHGMSTGGGFTVETAGPRTYVITVDPLTGRVASRQATR
jgi:general secretion pathway protein H